MIELPYAIVIGLVSAMLTGAITWGTFQAKLSQALKLIDLLTAKVDALTVATQELSRQVAVLQDRSDREPTGSHGVHRPS